MRYILILIGFLSYLSSYSQTVITRPYSKLKIHWNSDSNDYDWDSVKTKMKTVNPKIILTFEEITIIDGDTSKIYLNEIPESEEDSLMIEKKWYESNDESGRECYVFLFFYKKDNEYVLRILYNDDDNGIEYFMRPLKIDVIPFNTDLLDKK